MNTSLSKLFPFIFAIVFLSSCLSMDPKLINICDQKGTVVDHTGLDGCKWIIEQEDGSKLIPIAADQQKYNWKDGTQINFGFENENEINTCMAGQTIHLTCLKEVTAKPCDGMSVPVLSFPEDSFARQPSYNIIEHSVQKGMLTLKIGFSGCDPDRDFALWISNVASKSLPPKRTASINFTEQACLAYFVKELCFDISFLTEKTILTFHVIGQVKEIEVNP